MAACFVWAGVIAVVANVTQPTAQWRPLILSIWGVPELALLGAATWYGIVRSPNLMPAATASGQWTTLYRTLAFVGLAGALVKLWLLIHH
jgi:hypothetical protein